jgi:general secretion pathway protein M
MISALRHWWLALSRREQLLVGVAAALALVVVAGLVGRTVYAALDAQAERHRDAVARAARVEAKAALMTAAPAAASAATAGPLDQWLTQSAADAGLTLDRIDARGDRLASLAIASARAPGLMAWLAALEDQGLVIDRLVLNPGPDGNVALTAEVRRP